jgi:hypothetical protein
MAEVTGIGGVFFKSTKNDRALALRYQKNLGVNLADFGGTIFKWPDDKAEDRGLTVELAGTEIKPADQLVTVALRELWPPETSYF